MPRLPQPGADAGNWGDILNDYLSTAHSSDGTLKTDTVGAAQLKTNAVASASIAAGAVTSAKVADNAIDEVKLSAVQAKLNAAPTVPVTSVASKTGDVVLQKSDVGLSNVDNTSDVAKPISTAVQSALSNKVDTASLTNTFLQDAKVYRGRMVAIGDSITEVSSSRSNNLFSNNWPVFAVLASGGRLSHIYTCAKGGWNTTDVYGLYETEVIGANLSYDLLIVADGTNDTSPLTTTRDNNEKMIKRELGRGARVALATIPPSGTQAVGAPTGVTLTALPGYSGGTLAAGTYYYQVSCRTPLGSGTSASTEQTVTLSATGAIRIDWTPQDGASGYIVYGRTSGSGKGNIFINGPNTGQPVFQNQFIDLGTASPTGTLPSGDTSASPAPTAAVRTKVSQVNAVKRVLQRTYGVPIIDQYAILTDWTAQGRYKANYASDGTHPTFKAQRAMGINVASRLAPTLPLLDSELVTDPFDATNLFPPVSGGSQNASTTGGLLLSNTTLIGGGAGARPAGWSYYGDIASATNSLDVDATVAGNVYTLNRGDVYGAVYSGNSVSSGFSVGDKIFFAFKVKTSGLDAIDGGRFSASVKARNSTGSQNVTAFTISCDTPTTNLPGGWAVWSSEGIVPTGTTFLDVEFSLSGRAVSAKIAQVTVRNLTALGLN